MLRRVLAWIAVVFVVACGARSSLHLPDTSGAGAEGGNDATTATGGVRSCLPNCTVGHRCCIGGCDGPAVETVTDCCVCLAGEVNSSSCPNHACGKP